MTAAYKPQTHDLAELEIATDETILACGGDMREAIKALLVANASLEDRLASATPAISYGYARGHYGRAPA